MHVKHISTTKSSKEKNWGEHQNTGFLYIGKHGKRKTNIKRATLVNSVGTYMRRESH